MLEPGPGGNPARLPGHREDHLEVLGLGRAHDVDRPVHVQVPDPVPDGGRVGGVVAVAAVALAEDQRQRLAVPAGEPGREHAQRAVADHREPARLQFGAHIGQHRRCRSSPRGMSASVSVTPSCRYIRCRYSRDMATSSCHSWACSRRRPGAARPAAVPARRTPGRSRTCAGPPGRRRSGCSAAGRVGESSPTSRACSISMPNGVPQSPRWLSRITAWPVLEDPDDGVAHHGGPQVANVQFLGHVRAGVVHHDLLGRVGLRHAEPRVTQFAGGLRGDPGGQEPEVDEAGAAHLGRLGHAVQVEMAGDVRGDVARWPAELLGQRQGRVGLVVRERGRPDDRVGVLVPGAERRTERSRHPLREDIPWIRHTSSLATTPGRPAPINP